MARHPLPLEHSTFDHAALVTLENAERLRESARAAASIKNFGHARALLVLSLEELGKAIGFRLCAEGWARIEGKGKGKEFVIRALGDKRYRFASHSAKRDVTFGLGLLQLVLVFIRVIALLATGSDASPRHAAEAAQTARTGDLASLFPPELMDDVNDLDGVREGGLYVDFERELVMSPSAATQESFDRLNEFVATHFDTASAHVRNGVTAEVLRFLIEGLSEGKK